MLSAAAASSSSLGTHWVLLSSSGLVLYIHWKFCDIFKLECHTVVPKKHWNIINNNQKWRKIWPQHHYLISTVRSFQLHIQNICYIQGNQTFLNSQCVSIAIAQAYLLFQRAAECTFQCMISFWAPPKAMIELQMLACKNIPSLVMDQVSQKKEHIN